MMTMVEIEQAMHRNSIPSNNEQNEITMNCIEWNDITFLYKIFVSSLLFHASSLLFYKWLTVCIVLATFSSRHLACHAEHKLHISTSRFPIFGYTSTAIWSLSLCRSSSSVWNSNTCIVIVTDAAIDVKENSKTKRKRQNVAFIGSSFRYIIMIMMMK